MLSSNLRSKYVILYKIKLANWDLSYHGSCITPNLVGLLYQVESHVVFYFREYVFEKLMKHVEYYVVKLPVGFPSLTCRILSNQKKDIVTSDNEVGVI